MAVVGLHTANASVQSYATNLSYSKNNECIRLSKSLNTGIQGFLLSRGSGNQLDFYQVKNSDCDTCLVVEINEFPSFEKLKRQHKLKKLSQDVASCSRKVIYRKDKGDDQKFKKKRLAAPVLFCSCWSGFNGLNTPSFFFNRDTVPAFFVGRHPSCSLASEVVQYYFLWIYENLNQPTD